MEKEKFDERGVECFEGIDCEPIELLLQSSEEALHPAVLPRAAGIGSVMPDTEQRECEAKRPGGEDGFIVGSHGTGLAVAVDRLGQLHDQCPARLRDRKSTRLNSSHVEISYAV